MRIGEMKMGHGETLLRWLWWGCNMWGGMALLSLGGCFTMTEALPVSHWLAAAPNWQESRLAVGPYHVMMLERPGEGAVTVYIEGDGRSYITRDMPSPDPTPVNPIALKQALADMTGGTVIYLARPCQWVKAEEGPLCQTPAPWTTGRYTETIAAGYADAVARVAHERPLTVVGYSGGGWVAAQVASRVPHVVALRTIAGNVLPNAVNTLHHVPRMDVAPYPNVARLAATPQVHVVGGQDKTVPPEMAERFVEMLGSPPTARVERRDVGHGGF